MALHRNEGTQTTPTVRRAQAMAGPASHREQASPLQSVAAQSPTLLQQLCVLSPPHLGAVSRRLPSSPLPPRLPRFATLPCHQIRVSIIRHELVDDQVKTIDENTRQRGLAVAVYQGKMPSSDTFRGLRLAASDLLL
eukprot:1623083-Rhodomonas_salina.1